MSNCVLPENEEERLNELNSFNILDTPNESEFDEIVNLASHICEAPISLISLIDRNRQWFKSKVGVEGQESPRVHAFCSHAIMGDDLFTVENALNDERFSTNPYVINPPYVRFYAGYPLKTSNNLNLGTLCVIDTKPRKLSKFQEDSLKILANVIINKLELRLRNIQLQEAYEKQKRLIDYNNKLLSIIGHDLRAPVGAVISFLEIFGNEDGKEEFLKNLDLLKEQMSGLDYLLNNLLDWATMHFNTVCTKINTFIAYDIIKQQINNHKLAFAQKKNRVENNVPQDLELSTDPNIFAMAFRNLLNNANKFTQGGKISVNYLTQNNQHHFVVKDTGVGIEKERIPHLLNWERRDTTTGSSGELGSGLGLKIVKELLEKVGGDISISSEFGFGSEFTIILPMSQN